MLGRLVSDKVIPDETEDPAGVQRLLKKNLQNPALFEDEAQFTKDSHYFATFTNENGDSGTVTLVVATNLLPASLANRTIVATDSGITNSTTLKFIDGVRFTKTPANNGAAGSSSGTYGITRFSPISGLLVVTFTSPADVGS